ncbi:hypothetical protein HaLaN_27870, partial [Haematococcus lacustris]
MQNCSSWHKPAVAPQLWPGTAVVYLYGDGQLQFFRIVSHRH